MADERIVAQDTFEQSIKDILTILVNSTYDWQEYTDSEISDILEITDEQAMQLTKILNDQVVANNKLWSSSKTDAEIKNALIESNKYSDELIGKISSISLEYVTTLPTSDIKSNVIYILQGTPNTLNVFNESTSSFVSVGDLNLDLSGYYTSTEVDNLLADKADDNTVVHADAIVADLTTTSGTTVLSSAGLQTELDKKANDDEVLKTTDISKTINSTSTDSQVASAKLLYNELLKVSNDNYIEDANNPTSFICKTDSNTLNTPYKEGLTSATISLVISVARGADSWNGQISISMASSHFFIRNKGADGWNTWVKLITKTDMTTTINSSSTDAQIPSALSVITRMYNSIDSEYATSDTMNVNFNKTGFYKFNAPTKGVPENNVQDYVLLNIPWNNCYPNTGMYGIQLLFSPRAKGFWFRRIWNYNPATYVYTEGDYTVFTKWKSIGYVEHAAKVIAFDDNTNYEPNTHSKLKYTISNGMCHVTGGVNCISPVSEATVYTNMPKAYMEVYARGLNINGADDNDSAKIYINGTNLQIRRGVAGNNYMFTFSYPTTE